MRKIIVTTFITLDGVIQGPGAFEEDRSNGFKWGGWIVPHGDELTQQTMADSMKEDFDLLLGRFTYDIFAAYWPYKENNPIAEKFNRIHKYVVSGKPVELTWENSTLITGDIVAGLKQLKTQDGPNLLVNGSGKMVQTLLEHGLVDILHLWVFPITIGKGKRLFADGTQPGNWKLLDSKVSSTGVIIASYAPAGEIKLGAFEPDNPSAAERERRKRVGH
ncbi:dihydrofolate reductase family protein [Chitinophaga defluvii]|uniref:Dihydrofolate reductase family protein n=1 Tax=Chitinophaga defluvii TaxID=3163343 RepID=A0ABV2TBR6_9BACT